MRPLPNCMSGICSTKALATWSLRVLHQTLPTAWKAAGNEVHNRPEFDIMSDAAADLCRQVRADEQFRLLSVTVSAMLTRRH